MGQQKEADGEVAAQDESAEVIASQHIHGEMRFLSCGRNGRSHPILFDRSTQSLLTGTIWTYPLVGGIWAELDASGGQPAVDLGAEAGVLAAAIDRRGG